MPACYLGEQAVHGPVNAARDDCPADRRDADPAHYVSSAARKLGF